MRLIVAGAAQGTCTFGRQDVPADELKVVVGTGNVPSCPKGSEKVLGVGTQAARCRVPAAEGGSAEMIAGAVREIKMAVVLGQSKAQVAKSAVPVKHDLLEEMAEQVAGNLF